MTVNGLDGMGNDFSGVGVSFGSTNGTSRIDAIRVSNRSSGFVDVTGTPPTLPPEPTETFSSGLNTWTQSGGTWTTPTSGGQTYASTSTSSSTGTLTKNVSLSRSWMLDFDFDWQTQGSGGNGVYANTVFADVVNASGNGYRVVAHAGNSGSAVNNDKLIEIYKVVGGAMSGAALATGGGYNAMGWGTLGLTGPALKRVRLSYDRPLNTLTASIDSNNDGVYENVASVRDTTTITFAQIRFGASFTDTPALALDNVRIDDLI